MKALLFAISLFLPLVASANPVPDFPFVIVTETLEKEVKPDFATVRFSILAYDESANEAMQQLTQSAAQMLEALGKYGVLATQLESTQIDKNTKRARKDGAYNLEILGYEVQQGFNLKITDLEHYPGIMNTLVRLDGVQDIDALFETDNEEEHQAQMIRELSAKARAKADALAQAQSRKVKSVYGITTESNFGEAYAIFSLQYNPEVYGLAKTSAAYGMNLIMAVPEFIKVGQRVTAIYELK
ncbi:SIMPL domain-containing protein [Microbulbifer salipaludis]|uniref:SIMPL domain-containing protein n=1 Tax=Microbulbifer salipaludis TaxID=187980 RepID=A0ABS3E422_9GAMM|nr:SIMPL domain-containing protein [Microbulbifer salipaludis]MBN8430058.1 SIMPL domain-containing protein [Microbulbifer salipaludis]